MTKRTLTRIAVTALSVFSGFAVFAQFPGMIPDSDEASVRRGRQLYLAREAGRTDLDESRGPIPHLEDLIPLLNSWLPSHSPLQPRTATPRRRVGLIADALSSSNGTAKAVVNLQIAAYDSFRQAEDQWAGLLTHYKTRLTRGALLPGRSVGEFCYHTASDDSKAGLIFVRRNVLVRIHYDGFERTAVEKYPRPAVVVGLRSSCEELAEKIDDWLANSSGR